MAPPFPPASWRKPNVLDDEPVSTERVKNSGMTAAASWPGVWPSTLLPPPREEEEEEEPAPEPAPEPNMASSSSSMTTSIS